jgi:hypothetical protein
MKAFLFLSLCLGFVLSVCGEELTLGTYNVEYFDSHFLAHRYAKEPIAQDPIGKQLLEELRKKNDEDNWETASVILDPKFNPDILVIEEGCQQADLEYFNRRWLSNRYATVIQFPSNTDRQQHLCLLMKPGFKILERRDQYRLEPDPFGNERGSKLFARGPVFVKVQTPANYTFWLGVTHMKSKNVGPVTAPAPGQGESPETRQRKVAASKWRNREAVRTHKIIKELEQAGPSDVILLGDVNDSIGLDPYEGEGGGDAVLNLVGPAEDGLVLATKSLSDAGQHSFNGYWRTGFREFIDHVVVTASMKDQIMEVRLVNQGLAEVSSDHFPLAVRIKSDSK